MPRDEELMMMDPCAEFDALIFFVLLQKVLVLLPGKIIWTPLDIVHEIKFGGIAVI